MLEGKGKMIIPEIPRTYTALVEWAACIVYIMVLPKRFTRWKTVVIAIPFLAAQIMFLHITSDVPIRFWILCMTVAVGFMYLMIYVCCDLPVISVGYYCIRAFILAEFTASLGWQIHYFTGFRAGLISLNITLILVCGVAYWLEHRNTNDVYLFITGKEILSPLIIGIATFSFSNLSFISVNTPFSGRFAQDIFNTRTLMDFGGLVMLYAYHGHLRELYVKHEMKTINSVLQSQYVQYQQSRESIELINRKYHDIKHLITVLRAEGDSNKRNDYLDEMESDIMKYEAQNKTGNNVLDTVLTSKSLYCQKHGINLTCVADGHLLDFMNVMDICTIFGNALDNAIESVRKVKKIDERLIHVAVFKQKGFLMMRFENYYDGGELIYYQGIPITTKKDKEYHGYGIKSIKYSVKRYGGVTTINTRNQWFELKILIPLPPTH